MQWDGFTAMERDVRAMIADPRWAALPMPDRIQAMAARVLITPDGACWLFGTHARWHRHDRSDGLWHLSPPPLDPLVRSAARPARQSPPLPPPLIPHRPDVAYDRGSTQGFVGPDVPRDVTERVRALLNGHRGLRREDFPIGEGAFGDLFAEEVSSTVAAVWGTIIWSAYAPAFDGNEVLLSLFGEFLARPLPGDDWVRWIPSGGLESLASLYGERMRAGAHDAGLRLAGLMAETAMVLRADPRFRPRADALLAMVRPAPMWRGGDVRQSWLARLPPHLAAAAIAETAPGEHFRHTMYDLVEALGFMAERGADPRAVAASLLAADVAMVAPHVVSALYPWLDPQMRQAFYITLADPRHALRGCWPRDGELPPGLEPADRSTAAALLGAAYATGLAWCRLTGTNPPSHSFPAASAVARCLIHQRDDPVPAHPPIDIDLTETTSSWLYHM